MTTNKITDKSGDKKYWIRSPQIVMGLCRSPHDYTLWNVVKMVCGDSGECILSTDDLASLAMMSAGKASDSRAFLMAVGLLDGNLRRDPGYPQAVWHLSVPDVWEQNIRWRKKNDKLKDRVTFKEYQKKELKAAGVHRSFDKEKYFHSQELRQMTVKSLHNMKALQPSQYEEGVSQYEGLPSQYETKKNHEEEPKEEPKEEIEINLNLTPHPHTDLAGKYVCVRFEDKLYPQSYVAKVTAQQLRVANPAWPDKPKLFKLNRVFYLNGGPGLSPVCIGEKSLPKLSEAERELFAAFKEVIPCDDAFGAAKTWEAKELAESARKAAKKGYTPNQIRGFAEWHKEVSWRGKTPAAITLKIMQTNFTAYLEWKQNGGSNGHSANGSSAGTNQADDSDLDRRIDAKLARLTST